MTVLQPSCPASAGCCCCLSSEGRAQAAAAVDQISAAKTEAEWTIVLGGGVHVCLSQPQPTIWGTYGPIHVY